MKKAVLIFITIVVSVWCTGCMSLSETLSEMKKINGDGLARDCAKSVVENLNEKNTDGLIELFSETARTNPELEAQIEECYDYLGGKIVSYDEYIPVSGNERSEGGRIVRQALRPTIRNAQTEDGLYYKIYVHFIGVDIESPQYQGIKHIRISKTDADGHYIKNDEDENDEFVVGDPWLY